MTLLYADEIAANLERADQSIRAARQLATGDTTTLPLRAPIMRLSTLPLPPC